jgi:protein-disulfide isomerase
MPQIEKEYINTGKIKHVFMEFPLAMHQDAFKAAEAAECAHDQGKFWEMHDRLFSNQKGLGRQGLFKNAEALGLDVPKFKECLDGGKHDAAIRKDMAEGQKAGITGTPAFLLGVIQSDGNVKVVKKIVGAQPYSSFKSAIDGIR